MITFKTETSEVGVAYCASAMWESWVRSLAWEDALEKGKATHSNILAWRIPWTIHGVAKSWTRLNDFHFTLCPSGIVSLLGKNKPII